MKVGVIIQARMGSSRLPGKVLMKIGGVPLLSYLHNRLKNLEQSCSLIVATTNNSKDDILEDFCVKNKIRFWRGPELDVLSRFFQLSMLENFDIIVRLNADCPLLDANFVSDKIRTFLDNLPKFDYASTILQETYPLGMHVEIMTIEALEKAHKQCKNFALREHVTPYIYQNPQKFNLLGIQSEKNNSHVRLTIDYPEDIVFINKVIDKIKAYEKEDTVANVLKLLAQEDDLRIYNQHIKKNQKLH